MSNYTEFAVCPTWVHHTDANPEGYPKWSQTTPPPKIGEHVEARVNRIGICRVLCYFIGDGYLGLKVMPLNPPEWYVRQNGFGSPCHLYGSETAPGTVPEPKLDGPTPEQLGALQRYAKRYGCTWKRRLSDAWFTGADEREEDSGLLRQVRNEYGRGWLYSRRNPIKPSNSYRR